MAADLSCPGACRPGRVKQNRCCTWSPGVPRTCRAAAESPVRVPPGGPGIRGHGAIAPAPLAGCVVRLICLHRDPVGSRPERHDRVQRDREARAVRERHVRSGLKERPRQVARVVRVEVHVDRRRRAGAVEVLATDLDRVDVPADAAGDDEVVRELVVELVEGGLVVLRVRGERPWVVVLIVERDPRRVGCRPTHSVGGATGRQPRRRVRLRRVRLGARARARAGRHRQHQPRDDHDDNEGGQADMLPTQRRRRFHRFSPPTGLPPERFARRFLHLAEP